MNIVLFDLDGTLLDTLQDITDAVNFAMRKMNFPERSAREVRANVGNGVVRLIEGLLPQGKEHLLSETLSIFRPYYAEHAKVKSRPYEGIPEAIEALQKEGFLCGIVSNKPDGAVKELAKEFFPSFSLAWGEKPGIERKPAPDAILAALGEIGGNGKECIYIGDSEVDVLTAKNAGIPCIAVTWGFRDREILEKTGAEHLADTPRELYERIREIL